MIFRLVFPFRIFLNETVFYLRFKRLRTPLLWFLLNSPWWSSLYQKALLKLYHISLKFSRVCSRNTVNKENGNFSNGQSVDFRHRDYRHRYYMDRFVFPSLFTTIAYFTFLSNKTKKYSKHRKIFKIIKYLFKNTVILQKIEIIKCCLPDRKFKTVNLSNYLPR